MIIKREWHTGIKGCFNYRTYEGWYLFGIIPLYIIKREG